MKRLPLLFTAALVPLDFAALLLAGAAGYAIRFSPLAQSLREVTFALERDVYAETLVYTSLLCLAVFAVSGLYSVRQQRLASELVRLTLAISSTVALVLLIAFFSRELFESRFIFAAVWGLSVVFVSVERVFVRILQRILYAAGLGARRTLLLGSPTSTEHFAEYFQKNSRFGYRIEDSLPLDAANERELIAAKERGIDTIIITDESAPYTDVDRVKTIAQNQQLNFLYSAAIFPVSSLKPIMHQFGGSAILEIPATSLDGWGAIYKRGFDIIGSLLLIILTLPLQLFAGFFLVLERQGGIFYTQKRIGRSGAHFPFVKFRSMVKDAHKLRFDEKFIEKHGNQREGSPLFKLENDPRITKLGKFLRRTSIDELPQLYLVLLGHMSLVGPRPHLPEEVDMYEPHQRRVLTIKPGITGLAQISGRADLAFDDEVRLDMHYIQNWTPLMDFIILLKTPLAVVFSKGAY
jgi:exopolysaccharide biosynthesis polyprenyl glycosylphosphotransferase